MLSLRRALLSLALIAPSAVAQRAEIPAEGNPLASTDETLFPFPSRFCQVADPTAPSGFRMALPQRPFDVRGAARNVDFSRFNFADGQSPTAPLLVHFGVDVDPAQLTGQDDPSPTLVPDAPIALFDMVSGERVPLMTEMNRDLRRPSNEGRHALILRPMAPMAMGHRHVAVLTTALRDVDAAAIPTPPGFLALRDRVATQNAQLEAARDDYERTFAFLEEHGYPRARLLLAFDFMVASRDIVLGGVLSMRENALAYAREHDLGVTIEEVERDVDENTALLVRGTFEVPLYLDDNNALPRGPDGRVAAATQTAWYPFTLALPPQIHDGKPLSLCLFGHGIFGSGRRYLAGGLGRARIRPFAKRTASAVIATDFIGMSRGDRDLIKNEIMRDLNRTHVITDRLQQSLINNVILVESALKTLQHRAELGFDGRPLFDGERVYYYGVSLGGTQGTGVAALSPRIRRALLAVPGGAWSTMMTRSIVFKPLKVLVDALYPDPLLQQTYMSLMQSRFDGCDATNLGRLLRKEPLADAPSDRRVILMEAIGDCQVPNIATRIVARAIDAVQIEPRIEPVWGVEPAAASTPAALALAQVGMPERLARYRPPSENVLPAQDNGIHSQSVHLDEAAALLLRLIDLQ